MHLHSSCILEARSIRGGRGVGGGLSITYTCISRSKHCFLSNLHTCIKNQITLYLEEIEMKIKKLTVKLK